MHLRPENPKPLAEIGDMAATTRHQEGAAVWVVERPGNPGYKLVASGPGDHATSITMVTTENESE